MTKSSAAITLVLLGSGAGVVGYQATRSSVRSDASLRDGDAGGVDYNSETGDGSGSPSSRPSANHPGHGYASSNYWNDHRYGRRFSGGGGGGGGWSGSSDSGVGTSEHGSSGASGESGSGSHASGGTSRGGFGASGHASHGGGGE